MRRKKKLVPIIATTDIISPPWGTGRGTKYIYILGPGSRWAVGPHRAEFLRARSQQRGVGAPGLLFWRARGQI